MTMTRHNVKQRRMFCILNLLGELPKPRFLDFARNDRSGTIVIRHVWSSRSLYLVIPSLSRDLAKGAFSIRAASRSK